MKQGKGLPVFSGVAIGPAVVYRKSQRVLPVSSGDPQLEQSKFDAARETAREQLSQLYEKAKEELGEDKAAIVEVQMLMLDDLDYLDGVAEAIAGGAAAAIAALDTGESFAQIFAAMDDEYMNARSADIRDMSHRVYDILCGNTGFQLPEGSFLLVAEDLAPSETIQLPRERILAFVTRQGSSSSHTAILARTLNIPSLVQANLPLEDAESCEVLAVDGFTGTWYADPDPETLAMLKEKQAAAADARFALEAYRGKKSVTKSGKSVLLCANIGSPEDARAALAGDAEGVGLMRSEFLYLGRSSLPTEEHGPGERGESGAGSAGPADLSDPGGDFPAPAAGDLPGFRLWKPEHHVPHGGFPLGAEGGQGPVRQSPCGTDRRGCGNQRGSHRCDD